MPSDPVSAAGLVTREVRSGFRDGAATKIAIAHRAYLASQADLWDALTSAHRISRWFLPVSGDLRAGGRYQLKGNAGGVVERCREPESFAVTWEFGGMLSWVEVTLTPDGERTTLELAHEAPVAPGLWGQFGPGAVGVGWDLALMALGRHIDSLAAADPELAAAFPASPDGAEFIRAAAAGWAAAATADGDEPGAAQRAAERTVAFYTPPAATAGSLSAGGLRSPRRPGPPVHPGTACRRGADHRFARHGTAVTGADLTARRLPAPQGAARCEPRQRTRHGHAPDLRARPSRARRRPGMVGPARRPARPVLPAARRAGNGTRTRPAGTPVRSAAPGAAVRRPGQPSRLTPVPSQVKRPRHHVGP
jgi:uncharacterized protein YndB with AHSA1/START domain